MFKVTFDDSEIQQTLDAIAAKNYGPFLKDAGGLLQERTLSRLAAGTDPTGAAFIGNVGKYAKWKAEHYGGKPPLTLTGELRANIIPTFTATEMFLGVAEGAHGRITPSPPVSQMPDEYEAIAGGLETGIRGGHRLAGPRVFLGFSNQDIEDTYQRFIKAFEPELT